MVFSLVLSQDIINGSSGSGGKGKSGGKPQFPQGYGADVLRYWVAGTDFANDVALGPAIMASVSEALRKIRNTCRFLLGSVADWPLAGAMTPRDGGIASSDAARFGADVDALAQLWSQSPRSLIDNPDALTPLDRCTSRCAAQ